MCPELIAGVAAATGGSSVMVEKGERLQAHVSIVCVCVCVCVCARARARVHVFVCVCVSLLDNILFLPSTISVSYLLLSAVQHSIF